MDNKTPKGSWEYVCTVRKDILPNLQQAWEKDGKINMFRTCNPQARGSISAIELKNQDEIGIEKFVPTGPGQ